VIEWDKDLRVCQWSQQAETLFGWTAEEVIGKHPSEWRFVYEDDAERVNALLLQLLRGAASQYVCPNRNYTKNGAVLSCEWYLSALSDASGAFVSLLTFVLDVTQRQQAEEATRKSERRLRNLLDGLGPTIFVGLLSPEGVVLEVNRSALQMGGLEPGDVLGKRLEETLWWSHDESIRQRIRAAVQRAARGEAVRFDIVTRAAGDRSLVIDASLALFVDEQGVGLYVVASAVDITERKQAEEQLRSSLEQLRALTSRLHSIREEERTRMAREIHDELGQALTGLKMDLAWLDRRLAEVGNEAQRGLLLTKTQAMTQLIDETIHTVRRLASELRPGVLDNLGLLAALEWQAQDFHARTDIPCVLSTALQELALSREQETTIFRICQEALTNVMRHAQAARVDICLAQDNGCLVLEVHDDGRGITTEEIMAKESLGLLGMQERARLVNGEVTISGTAREGTTVTVRVPMGK
jgi:PAS domain S-box-containing protein